VHVLDRFTAPAAVDAVFEGLSEHSRYLRFHAPMPRLTKAFRDRLIDVDGQDHAAVAATVVGEPIGIARLVKVGCGRAEVAMAVVDRWQRHGVGQRLLTELGELAATLRYTELYGDVLPENTAMIRLACRAMPGVRTAREDDVVRITYSVGWAFSTLTHEELLTDLLHH
jgi:GNAT superfamily N-acetyltransferase